MLMNRCGVSSRSAAIANAHFCDTCQRQHFHMLLHQLCSIQSSQEGEQRAGGATSPEGEPAATVAAALPPAAGTAAAGLSLAARKAVKSASSSCETVQTVTSGAAAVTSSQDDLHPALQQTRCGSVYARSHSMSTLSPATVCRAICFSRSAVGSAGSPPPACARRHRFVFASSVVGFCHIKRRGFPPCRCCHRVDPTEPDSTHRSSGCRR